MTYVYVLQQDDLDDRSIQRFAGVYATEEAAIRDRDEFRDDDVLEVYGYDPFHITRELLRS